MGRRERVNDFVERHEVAWELTMAALAIIWVGLGFLIDEVGPGTRTELDAAELLLTLVFVVEFGGRLLAAHDRPQYLRGHWVDALALAPPVRGAPRVAAPAPPATGPGLLRHLPRQVEGLARHRGFAWLLVGWLSVMVICSGAVYAAEHGVNRLIESPFDAL
jgi:hypothetical protein